MNEATILLEPTELDALVSIAWWAKLNFLVSCVGWMFFLMWAYVDIGRREKR